MQGVRRVGMNLPDLRKIMINDYSMKDDGSFLP